MIYAYLVSEIVRTVYVITPLNLGRDPKKDIRCTVMI